VDAASTAGLETGATFFSQLTDKSLVANETILNGILNQIGHMQTPGSSAVSGNRLLANW
jgi:hypothetical protein